jgi:predicted phage-related endonuclease
MIERREITSEAEWLSWRDHDVTASDVGGLFGLDPREEKTPAALFYAKQGVKFPDPDNSVLRRGRWLEGAFPNALRDKRPSWRVIKAHDYWRDPSIRLAATPDFYIEGDARGLGVLEAKTTEADLFEKYWTQTTPPAWVALQIATQMMLCGAHWGAIGCLILGYRRCELQLYEVPRHAGAESRIREAVERFWTNLGNGIEPALDYARDGALLSILYPREEPGKIVDLRTSNRLPELLARRAELADAIAVGEAAKKEIEAEIRDQIGDAERALVNGWSVTLKAQERKAHEVKASKPFRVLRAKKTEEAA